MNDLVYTVKEVADLLKLNPETIKRMIRRGDLKGKKIANSWRVPREEVERLLNEN